MFKTKEQRRREIRRFILSKQKEKEKLEQSEIKEREKYPDFINTLSKRIKRLDPSYGVQSMDYHNCTYVTYFKLKQSGFNDLKIICTNSHAWVEFLYNDEWWIFDPIAIRELKLGNPIKRKKFVSEDEYKTFGRIFSQIEYYENAYGDKLHFDRDEAKIAAMKDIGLNNVLRHKLV